MVPVLATVAVRAQHAGARRLRKVARSDWTDDTGRILDEVASGRNELPVLVRARALIPDRKPGNFVTTIRFSPKVVESYPAGLEVIRNGRNADLPIPLQTGKVGSKQSANNPVPNTGQQQVSACG